VRALGLKNVVSILVALDDPLLADACVGRFFICDTWHCIDNHARELALIKNLQKPGGQVVMVDYNKGQTSVGPLMEMRIRRDDLLKQMEANGLKLAGVHPLLPYQYFLVFTLQ